MMCCFGPVCNDEGLFGILATISSSNITLFMILRWVPGRISGASDFVIELPPKWSPGAMQAVGRPFVAVTAPSALTGTISGSAVANTGLDWV